MGKLTYSTKKARVKLQSLQGVDDALRELPAHLAFAVQAHMMQTELNGSPINIVTGNLRRSTTVGGEPYKAVLRQNLSIAPYAIEVAERLIGRLRAKSKGDVRSGTRRIFGMDYQQLAVKRMKPEIDKAIEAEFSRFKRIWDAGNAPYRYDNPFFT